MSFLEYWTDLTPGTILPVPAGFQPDEAVGWAFTLWASGFALLVLPWMFHRLRKENDPVPLLMWTGGLICSVLEPMLDNLGHLWYPTNLPGPAFIGFGTNVPLLAPPAYAFFIAMTGYFAFRCMQRGLSMRGVTYVWLVLCASDMLCEYPGVFFGAYAYYGDQPFKFFNFPWWWAWINGTSMLTTGFLLWLVVPHLKEWHKALIVLVPVTGFGVSYGMTAWPDFMALNWRMPNMVAWLLSVFSLFLCLIVVRGIAAIVAQKSPMEADRVTGARLFGNENFALNKAAEFSEDTPNA